MTWPALSALGRLVYAVAMIISGECGGVLPEAAPLVAQVAMNRYAAGMGWAGWHGVANVKRPHRWAWAPAYRAVIRGGDADGPLFALSCDDLGGIEQGECVRKGRWCICAMEVWPDDTR